MITVCAGLFYNCDIATWLTEPKLQLLITISGHLSASPWTPGTFSLFSRNHLQHGQHHGTHPQGHETLMKRLLIIYPENLGELSQEI